MTVLVNSIQAFLQAGNHSGVNVLKDGEWTKAVMERYIVSRISTLSADVVNVALSGMLHFIVSSGSRNSTAWKSI